MYSFVASRFSSSRLLPLFAVLLLSSSMAPQVVSAQTLASYALQEDSKMWIEGTSNKNDWSVYATELTGQVMKNPDGTMTEPGIDEAEVVVESSRIVSRKSSIMDRLMRNALAVQQHPKITYAMKSAEVASSSDESFTLNTMGELTLVGTTKEIEMTVEGEEVGDGQLKLTGSYALLMSDFNIERPKAMYGALRTGDEVVVHFELVVAREEAQE